MLYKSRQQFTIMIKSIVHYGLLKYIYNKTAVRVSLYLLTTQMYYL